MHKNLTSLTCLILKICSAYQQFTTEKKNLAKSCKHHLYKTITETKSFAELLISRDFSCSLRNYFLFKDCAFFLYLQEKMLSLSIFFFFWQTFTSASGWTEGKWSYTNCSWLTIKEQEKFFFQSKWGNLCLHALGNSDFPVFVSILTHRKKYFKSHYETKHSESIWAWNDNMFHFVPF